MRNRIVVGIFHGKGTAEDAQGRLVFEGAREADIALRVLREIAPMPSGQFDALTIDPFEELNYLANRYQAYIRNGETAVLVRVQSEAEEERALNTLKAYSPLFLESVEPGEENAVVGSAIDEPSRPG